MFYFNHFWGSYKDILSPEYILTGFAADENAQLPDDDVMPMKFQGPVGFMGAVSGTTGPLNLGIGELF